MQKKYKQPLFTFLTYATSNATSKFQIFSISRFTLFAALLLSVFSATVWSDDSADAHIPSKPSEISTHSPTSSSATQLNSNSLHPVQSNPNPTQHSSKKHTSAGFVTSTANAVHFAKILPELTQAADKQLARMVVELTNNQLYGTSLAGEPAVVDRHLAFIRKHNKFCSPISGYETKLLTDCNMSTPIVLQHADIKPPQLKSRLNADDSAIARNWLQNFGMTDEGNIPSYLQDPSQLELPKSRDAYINRLLDQRWGSLASESLSHILTRRMIVDPKNPNSPSITSAIEQEVNGRYPNPEWQKEVTNTNNVLDIAKEQLRVSALSNILLQSLHEREERNGILLSAMLSLLAEQQSKTREIYKFIDSLPVK